MTKKPSEIPAPWRPLLERRGFSSMRALSTASGVAPTTVSRAMRGVGDTQPATVQRLAETLQVEPAEVRRLVDGAEQAPFRPHQDADLLDDEERRVVNELIRLLALRHKVPGRGGRRDDRHEISILVKTERTANRKVEAKPPLELAASEDDSHEIEDEQGPEQT